MELAKLATVLRPRFRGFCTVFGFSLFGRVGVYSGISQWYRVGDAGALRAEPLATLMSCAVKRENPKQLHSKCSSKCVSRLANGLSSKGEEETHTA